MFLVSLSYIFVDTFEIQSFHEFTIALSLLLSSLPVLKAKVR